MLITIDNFLDQEDFFNLREIAYGDSLRWETQASSRNLLKRTIFDYSEIICEDSDCIRLSQSKFFISLFNLVKDHIKKNCSLGRIYFNRQRPCVDGCLHTDEGDYTALLYVSDYENEWGGFTQFFHSESKQEYVLPVPNRLVIFDASIQHKGFGFSHNWNPDRISLAFKMYID